MGEAPNSPKFEKVMFGTKSDGTIIPVKVVDDGLGFGKLAVIIE